MSIALEVEQENPKCDSVWATHTGGLNFLTWHWKAVLAELEIVA